MQRVLLNVLVSDGTIKNFLSSGKASITAYTMFDYQVVSMTTAAAKKSGEARNMTFLN
jgi:hypothetical protein